MIGDESCFISDGQSITQTLYAKGQGKPPYLGASPRPVPDPEVPDEASGIIIRYHEISIKLPHGEGSVLAAVTEQQIDELLLTACPTAPEQSLGIVSPEVAPRDAILLRHRRLGEACVCVSFHSPDPERSAETSNYSAAATWSAAQ